MNENDLNGVSGGVAWLMQNLEAKLKLLLGQPVVTNSSFFFATLVRHVSDVDGCGEGDDAGNTVSALFEDSIISARFPLAFSESDCDGAYE